MTDAVRTAEAAGEDERAVRQLTALKALVNDAALVTDADVRDTLIRDADAMIVRLGGTVSAAGVRANAGEPVTGAGRLAGTPPGSPRTARSDGPAGERTGPMRSTRGAVAVLVDLLLAVLPVTGPAWAHTGKPKLEVAGDGATGVTVQARYADGHRLDTLVRLTLTATGAGGRAVGPLQLEPAGEGQGF